MPNRNLARETSIETSPRLTLCLAMDLKASTQNGLRLSTRRLDRFNLALVNQLPPYLEAVELDDALIKFTGDGWLIMSDDPNHAAPLCCLAMIMSRRFRADIADSVRLSREEIPALRLAISWVRDLPVQLHNRQRDFVGDSARHAVRACQLCRDNEILIDETVYRWVRRDVVTTPLNLNERLQEFPDVKLEERLVLHVLEEMKLESAEDEDAPVCFVNTLSLIGRRNEAESLATRISSQLQTEAEELTAEQRDLLERFNQLLASKLDYETTSSILRDMQAAGLEPNIETFNALLSKTEDHTIQSLWVQRMQQEGIAPNEQTLNILIEQAPDVETIRQCLDEMMALGVQPDVVTLNTLVERTEDDATAQQWLKRMQRHGVQPNRATFDRLIEKTQDVTSAIAWIDEMVQADLRPTLTSYLNLFAKDLTPISGDDLIEWYLELPYHPPEPMHRAIASYRRKGHIVDALRLALDYPYTEAALRVMREHPEQTLAYFRSVVDEDPDHANGTYALGIALVELGEPLEAEHWLSKALELAKPGPRKNEVVRYLKLVDEEAQTPLPHSAESVEPRQM